MLEQVEREREKGARKEILKQRWNSKKKRVGKKEALSFVVFQGQKPLLDFI